jgi:hypothetical protein
MKKFKAESGFTLVEFLVGSAVMLVVILGTLSLYVRSNKVSVEQQQYAEVQHDVRSAMFFIERDSRSAGVGLTAELAAHFVEGKDAYSPGPEQSDCITLFGNFDNPLDLRIEDYSGGSGGGAATAFLYQWSLEGAPYECPGFYENKVFLIISTRCPGCFVWRFIGHNGVHGCGAGEEHFNMQPGFSELNPPGGLVDPGVCPAECWIDAIITLGQIRKYWVDTTGNPGDYPDLVLTAAKGYTGVPNTLYLTTIADNGEMIHMALAQDIENLQFQYNGDMNNDQLLDGFVEWNDAWTEVERAKIHQIRVWVLGRTPDAFTSLSGSPPGDIHLYRRPTVANSSMSAQDDRHKRFLMESTATVRNIALTIYNTGTR